MSQEQIEAMKLTVSRIFEWLSRVLQMVLVALILWFGSEVVELRTVVAVLNTRLEATEQLAGANLLAVSQRVEANDKRLDRMQRHLESVDGRLRAVEPYVRRSRPGGGPR